MNVSLLTVSCLAFFAICFAVGMTSETTADGGFDRIGSQPKIVQSVYALTFTVVLLVVLALSYL